MASFTPYHSRKSRYESSIRRRPRASSPHSSRRGRSRAPGSRSKTPDVVISAMRVSGPGTVRETIAVTRSKFAGRRGDQKRIHLFAAAEAHVGGDLHVESERAFPEPSSSGFGVPPPLGTHAERGPRGGRAREQAADLATASSRPGITGITAVRSAVRSGRAILRQEIVIGPRPSRDTPSGRDPLDQLSDEDGRVETSASIPSWSCSRRRCRASPVPGRGCRRVPVRRPLHSDGAAAARFCRVVD